MMSCEQYVAICYPLNYSTVMNRNVCIWLVTGSWMRGFFSILVPTMIKLELPCCGPNIINHFFCYHAHLLYLSCAVIRLVEFIDFIISLSVLLGSLLLMVISYMYIICTIIHIPSDKGREKAFSTCASHFTVVTIGYSTSIFIYVRPSQVPSLWACPLSGTERKPDVVLSSITDFGGMQGHTGG
ncbi:olfactory receptor 6J1-like [Gopherus flavomarginatus]|uniref:olfactory receptor 6J1-like n=1 Tax=Gopherus flavomarginatus TaxID=286002 RepID=UPI0021CC3D01|nr:olfactory receptor 6J1-like [Gopherus flavomarginatus]